MTKSPLEESIKAKIKALAKERQATFAELWRNLILERFLSRLAHSQHREKFILKGGILLAKYIPIGRETQDLDFFIRNLSNAEQSLRPVLQTICDINANDSFTDDARKGPPRRDVSPAQAALSIYFLRVIWKSGATV
jgi:hypothetical protein